MTSASEVLAMAGDPSVKYLTFKAAAKEVLGDEVPETKTAIVAALEAQAGAPNKDTEAPTRLMEVQVLRKYQPFHLYEMDEVAKRATAVLDDNGKMILQDTNRPIPIPAGYTVELPFMEAKALMEPRKGIQQRATFTDNSLRAMA